MQQGGSMKSRNLVILAVALMSIGCGVSVNSSGNHNEPDRGGTSYAYVNTYLHLPAEITDLIAPSADGYFSPALSRYDNYLYPSTAVYDPKDLPCYVRSDFNGDGYDDFAFLFSAEDWNHGSWNLTTKLVVALSTPHGYDIGADEILGTVQGDAGTPIEEYWSIFWVTAGTHSLTTYKNGVKVTKTVTLDDDAFYLSSLDPNEEALFYASGSSIYETNALGKTLAKKQGLSKSASGSARIIPFVKNVEGRTRPVQ
jgi:hypothetical protein